MRLGFISCAFALGVLTVGVSTAQTASNSTHSAFSFRPDAQIRARANALLQKAKTDPTGVVSEILDTYPGYRMMVVARDKTAPVEIHAKWADVMIVLDGEGTEVTGGTVVDGKLDPATGETRGARMEGGTRTHIAKGDVINIPAGMPHWCILAPGKSITTYIVKVAAPK